MVVPSTKKLRLKFHGRVLDHLGIQMYQSPVAAIAELVANAWDADAENVAISLPENLNQGAEIIIEDDGIGMTFDECQSRYLNVGWCRRGDKADDFSPEKHRPILGRKGIGKFAGFGIAAIVRIETTSKETGEKTVFELDINQLRSKEYVSTKDAEIPVLEYLEPDQTRKTSHGTRIILKQLKLAKRPSIEQYRKSMARRFLLHQGQSQFKLLVNGQPLPESFDLAGIQYAFPRDYRADEKPASVTDIDANGWGKEIIGSRTIFWRFLFHKDPIDDEELRGVAVFVKGKLAQAPFLFNLTGGLGGQHGVEYLTGQLQADFLDALPDDLIAPERQRINWEHEESHPIQDWGQKRIKELLRIWRERRGESRTRQLDEKVAEFSGRLEKLQPHEAVTIKRALRKLAEIPTLNDEQFVELGNAVLTSWEQGRLKELIGSIADVDSMAEGELIAILIEAQALTALNMAEAVKTRLLTIGGLKLRIESQRLETEVRDYIASNPWLISPQWETFRVEKSVKKLLDELAEKAGLQGEKWGGRIDLTLASGDQLLIIEFMRPGLKLDWDHIQRFERYILLVRKAVEANTGGRFRTITGYLVADALEADPANVEKITSLKSQGMFALDWQTLLSNALAAWQEFLEILADRAPQDERLKTLIEDGNEAKGRKV
jgi:hypothetical protein